MLKQGSNKDTSLLPELAEHRASENDSLSEGVRKMSPVVILASCLRGSQPQGNKGKH